MNFLEPRERNQDYLSGCFENLLNGAGAIRPLLVEFAEVVKEQGRVGVNMRPMVLLDFLGTDEWLNIHRWARRKSV